MDHTGAKTDNRAKAEKANFSRRFDCMQPITIKTNVDPRFWKSRTGGSVFHFTRKIIPLLNMCKMGSVLSIIYFVFCVARQKVHFHDIMCTYNKWDSLNGPISAHSWTLCPYLTLIPLYIPGGQRLTFSHQALSCPLTFGTPDTGVDNCSSDLRRYAINLLASLIIMIASLPFQPPFWV